MKLFQVTLLVLAFCSLAILVNAQQTLPPKVKTELAKRNIEEEALRAKLIERGINPDDLTQEELLILQPELENIIAELEAEARDNVQEISSSITPEITDNIQDAVEDGSSVKEAISEEIVEFANENRAAVTSTMPEIYGHRIFQNGSISVFRSTESTTAPDSYQLGVGDEIAVNIFGASQVDFLFRIDNQGFIRPPGLAKILLKGLSLFQARELVRKRLSQYYVFDRGQFAMNVNGARTIRVNIFGEVAQSGTYTLSAVNGALNALVAAGGPNNSGSVRKIQRNRGSQQTIIDVYDYLTDPSSLSNELSLQSSDIIFVPLAQNIINLGGAVKRPMLYELLPKEGLLELLSFAGGFTSGAYPDLIQIQRLVAGKKTIIDVQYQSLIRGQNVALYDGDKVVVRELNNPEELSVSVLGAVELAGEFEWSESLRLSEIVKDARLRQNARTDVAILRRSNQDGTSLLIEVKLDEALQGGNSDILMKSGDILEIFSQNTYVSRATVSITGAVRNPIASYPYSIDSSITVSNLITLSGGLSDNAAEKAIIFRREASNKKIIRYQLVDLQQGSNVTRLNPFDSLVVFPKELYSDKFPLEIKGAVRRPGSYTYDPSLGIDEIFTLAGGFTFGAAINRVEVFRLEFGNDKRTETRVGTIELNANYEVVGGDLSLTELSPYDVIVVRNAPEFEVTKLVNIEGEVKFPGTYALTDDIYRVSDLVKASGGITSKAFPPGATLFREDRNSGYVILELDKILSNGRSPNNIALLPGDIIRIPKAHELVSIRTKGTLASEAYTDSLLVNGNVVLAYQGDQTAKWYIAEYAGGFDKRVRKKTVTVRDPSGRLRKTKSFIGLRKYPKVTPGSSIAVQIKPPKPEKPPKEPIDWAAFGSAITTSLTAALTLVLIIDRL